VRPFSQSGVYVADADGSDETFVHAGASPAWSPDSSRLVVLDTDGLYVVDADGSDAVKLPAPLDSSGNPLEGVDEPGWRPDGGAVSFVASDFAECMEVFTMSLDGTGVTPVTAADCDPQVLDYDWAPDGSSIVFSGWTCELSVDCVRLIFEADVPDGAPTPLTAAGDREDLEPAVSPDGT
jgi:Tol biopolymer transport system component